MVIINHSDSVKKKQGKPYQRNNIKMLIQRYVCLSIEDSENENLMDSYIANVEFKVAGP